MFIVRASLAPILYTGIFVMCSPCTAQSFAHIPEKAVKPVSATGGALLANGKIAAGDGFSASHPGKGDYLLQFKAGQFAGLPVYSCTPIGENAAPPVCIVWVIEWTASGPSSVEFRFFTSDTHLPVNTGFVFTEFTTKTTT